MTGPFAAGLTFLYNTKIAVCSALVNRYEQGGGRPNYHEGAPPAYCRGALDSTLHCRALGALSVGRLLVAWWARRKNARQLQEDVGISGMLSQRTWEKVA